MMKTPEPITLSNDVVTLIPMTMDYVNEFYEAGKNSEVWRWTPPYQCESLDTARQWVASALEEVAKGQQVMFGIIDNASGRFVGSTRYCSIDVINSGIEIGFTFIEPSFQRTHINTNAKLLLLSHAFEELNAVRVQLRTHEHNQKSRNAIERLGATFEGILRNHRLLSTGEYRNTALFSLLSCEWLAKKALLSKKITEGVKSDIAYQVNLEPDIIELITESPLAQIIIDNGAQIFYVPVRLDLSANTLIGHLSVNNKALPLLNDNANVIIVFEGDDAYISPLLHDKIKVPTWVYRRVHIKGSCNLLPKQDNQHQVALQVKQFEGAQWSIDDQPPAMINNMLDNIRCFAITINAVEKQFKLEENKPVNVKEAIATKLIASGQLSLGNVIFNEKTAINC